MESSVNIQLQAWTKTHDLQWIVDAGQTVLGHPPAEGRETRRQSVDKHKRTPTDIDSLITAVYNK